MTHNHEKPGFLTRLKERIEGFINPVLNFWRRNFGRKVEDVLRPHLEDDPSLLLTQDLARMAGSMDSPDVVYLGCGDDLSVQSVFPDALHVDLENPTVHINRFQKDDICHLSLPDASQDLAVMQAMRYTPESDPRSAVELARILKPNGKLVRNFPVRNDAPKHLDEALCQIHYLLIERNYGLNGLVLDQRLSSENVLFTRGSYDDSHVSNLLEVNRQAFFNILTTIDLDWFTTSQKSPFLRGRWAYHRAFEFVFGISLQSPIKEIRDQLKDLCSSFSDEDRQKIFAMVELLKRDYF